MGRQSQYNEEFNRRFAGSKPKVKKMARKSKKSKNKHYPVQRKITMGVTLPTTPGSTFQVQADRLLSNVNHRLYRQSRIYRLKVDLDIDVADATQVEVYALSDTWYNQKAYQLAKETFDENSMQEVAQLGDRVARWQDFRVAGGFGFSHNLDAVQYTGGVVGTRFINDEYEISEVHDSSGNANTFRWIGTGTGTWNIIDEYDVTGSTDDDPTTSTGDVAYSSLEDTIDVGQSDHLQQAGNAPPYDPDTIENQCMVKVGTLFVNRTVGTVKLSTGFFDAPCGLLFLYSPSSDISDLSEKLHLSVQGGEYKGVHAPSYLE